MVDKCRMCVSGLLRQAWVNPCPSGLLILKSEADPWEHLYCAGLKPCCLFVVKLWPVVGDRDCKSFSKNCRFNLSQKSVEQAPGPVSAVMC